MKFHKSQAYCQDVSDDIASDHRIEDPVNAFEVKLSRRLLDDVIDQHLK